MSPIRNTARKTTGPHTKLCECPTCRGYPDIDSLDSFTTGGAAAALKSRSSQLSETPQADEPSLKRARKSCPPANTSFVKKEIISCPSDSDLPEPPVPTHYRLFGMAEQPSSSAPQAAASPSTDVTSETLTKRRTPNTNHICVLDKSICLCTRFATWLESQKQVHDDVLFRAVERDGAQFLRLARAALLFDNALRGHVPTPAQAVLDNPLREHARTLRVFAEFLRSKVAEGMLSEELQAAVLRDGEALFRLAVCCLDFDQAIRSPGSAS